jgi:hypothetical protein
VAVVAGNAARYMGRVFAGCCEAVMAGTAGAQYLRMVNCICWHKNIGVVAVLANVRRLYVLQVFANRINAVVATHAVAGNIDVVECGRPPRNGGVTIIAGIVAGNVSWVFTDSNVAVMTGAAVTNNLRMVDGQYRRENIRAVAVLADFAGLDVIYVFTDSFDPIVAVDATSDDTHMIEVCRQPSGARMAVIAGFAASDMCRILARGYNTVVAGST